MDISVTIKTTISDNRNDTALIFKQICDAVITKLSNKHFFNGYTFYESYQNQRSTWPTSTLP